LIKDKSARDAGVGGTGSRRVRDSDSDELRQLTLFAGMSADSFAALTRAGYIQTFPPAIELVTQGDPPDFLHILTDGAVELFAEWSGDEATMAILRPVSTFVLAATVTDRPYLMSARTLEKTRLILLPSEDVRAVFHADRAFAEAIVTELAHCYRSTIRHAKDLKLRSALERLANYLLRQHHRRRGAVRFDLDIEKRKLAAYLAMKPENLSRAFASLRAYGVEVDGPVVSLGDVAALERLARPSPLIDGPM
jgi:CRP/FNR family transcriptional activator FtrB